MMNVPLMHAEALKHEGRSQSEFRLLRQRLATLVAHCCFWREHQLDESAVNNWLMHAEKC